MSSSSQTAAQAPKSPAIGQLRSIEVLRGLAALFVVTFHSTVLWRDKSSDAVFVWNNGSSGVDLFFVISGFIMVISTRRLVSQSHGWRRFLIARAIRIVPLYWLATAVKLLAIVAVPAIALHTRPTTWNVLASFLFIPSFDGDGFIRPILEVGWTLSFELFFYIVFTCSLFFLVSPLRVVAPVMMATALLSLVRTDNWPAATWIADPLVLEFVFGALLAYVFTRWQKLQVSSGWAIAAGLAGLCCLTLVPMEWGWDRVLVWGLAASAVLAAAVVTEDKIRAYLPHCAGELGKASYALYLTHGFVLPVVGIVVMRAHLTGRGLGTAIVSLSLVSSVAVALAVHRYVEAPLTRWLRHIVRDTGARAALALPAAAQTLPPERSWNAAAE